MHATHRTMVMHSHAKQSMTKMSKDKKSCRPNTKPCHKPYKFDLEAKGQHHIRTMNVRNTVFYGNRPCAKYGKPMSFQKQEARGPYRSHEKTVQINKHIQLYHNVY